MLRPLVRIEGREIYVEMSMYSSQLCQQAKYLTKSKLKGFKEFCLILQRIWSSKDS